MDYHLKISSFAGLVAGAHHFRGRVEGENPGPCHGRYVHFYQGTKTCDEGHEIPGRAEWTVEAAWTEARYKRYSAKYFDGDGPDAFDDQQALIEVAIQRFKGELPVHWWDDKAIAGQPGDRLILGSGLHDPDDPETPKPDGIHPWGCVLAEIPAAVPEAEDAPAETA